ncbi:PREDICTED: uncharacterized protein LOC105312290 [Amphimedon queenslandica]|uniref:Fe2OG dioxygenase domain-containing protein n=1 Tax=Amphimedon queenslandica TaxID=400682 RepID=A0A1X7V6W1_AMPQE|nr:PREDICTED: uncharacterized protein LOC105312290 [Amphimedon queenslandica]|eukprot:XP_011403122.1 PREDICTED: uncharacterized protein LOC105312290 [Amphimedon queenslandica]
MEDPIKWPPVFEELRPSLQDNQSMSPAITVAPFLKEGLSLSNALTPEECKAIVSLTESKGYQDASQYCYMYNDRYNDRYMSDDPKLSEFIWDRLKPYIPARVEAFDAQWSLEGLNTRFRFCKYVSGHYFGAHTDGIYTINSDHKSILTCMFYLNGTDEFEGGLTNFITHKTRKLKHSVTPEPGLCVIFPQANLDFYHEGTKVTSGVKYIMRTDVMYKRITS